MEGGRFLEHVAVFLVRILFRVTLMLVWGDPRSVVLANGRVAQPTTGVKMRATSTSFAWSTSQSPERETRRYHQRPSMRVFVAYFSQMGSAGCEEDPKFLLARHPAAAHLVVGFCNNRRDPVLPGARQMDAISDRIG